MGALRTSVLLTLVVLGVGGLLAAMVVVGSLLQIDAVSISIKPSTLSMLLPCLLHGCVGCMVPLPPKSSQGSSMVRNSDISTTAKVTYIDKANVNKRHLTEIYAIAGNIPPAMEGEFSGDLLALVPLHRCIGIRRSLVVCHDGNGVGPSVPRVLDFAMATAVPPGPSLDARRELPSPTLRHRRRLVPQQRPPASAHLGHGGKAPRRRPLHPRALVQRLYCIVGDARFVAGMGAAVGGARSDSLVW